MFYTLLAFWVVLSGYCFVSTWHWTRYLLKRLPSQQLYFRSAFWGGLLFILSTVLAPYVELSAIFVNVNEQLSKSLTISELDSAPVQLVTYALVTSLLGLFGGL